MGSLYLQCEVDFMYSMYMQYLVKKSKNGDRSCLNPVTSRMHETLLIV